MNNSELTDKARGVARTLTYNDDTPQAQAKHTLLELAHRLDTANVRLHRKADGVLATTALGAVSDPDNPVMSIFDFARAIESELRAPQPKEQT